MYIFFLHCFFLPFFIFRRLRWKTTVSMCLYSCVPSLAPRVEPWMPFWPLRFFFEQMPVAIVVHLVSVCHLVANPYSWATNLHTWRFPPCSFPNSMSSSKWLGTVLFFVLGCQFGNYTKHRSVSAPSDTLAPFPLHCNIFHSQWKIYPLVN